MTCSPLLHLNLLRPYLNPDRGRAAVKIVIASRNGNKIREMKMLLNQAGVNISVLGLDDIGMHDEIEENGSSFEENALIKARAASALGYIGIADDSGLCVDALNGAPGVYSARFAGEPCNDERNNEKLLSLMSDVPDEKRTGRYISAIAASFPDTGRYIVTQESCEGRILRSRRGTGGFGYDPLFLYEPLGKTFAEITIAEKNQISHRAKAMRKFCVDFAEALKTYGGNHDE